MADEESNVQPESEVSEDESEFRCMYCNMPTLVYSPIVTYLGDDGYWVDGPYENDGYWADEESEEGYLCMTCGSHCSVEEVYWWSPGDPEPGDEDDEYVDDLDDETTSNYCVFCSEELGVNDDGVKVCRQCGYEYREGHGSHED